MVQLTPQSRIFVATQPIDFRKDIDGVAAVCRQVLGEHPLSGAVFVFRNRSATALKLLFYDGQGYWLCTKRLSQGQLPVVAAHRGRTRPLSRPRAPRAPLERGSLASPNGS